MNNKNTIIHKKFEKVLFENLNIDKIQKIKNKNYSSLGIDYWNWIEFLGNLEIVFSRDLTETTNKFKIETINQALTALLTAPKMTNIYKN